jgi:hypothetical protein
MRVVMAELAERLSQASMGDHEIDSALAILLKK